MLHLRTSFLLTIPLSLLVASFDGAARGQTQNAPSALLQGTNLVRNSGAEPADPESIEGWFRAQVPAEGLRMWRDTKDVRVGKSSFAITNTHVYPRPACNNWAQVVENVPPGTVLQLNAYIKTQDAKDVIVCAQCIGDELKTGFLAFAATPTVKGTQDWTEMKSESFVVPQGTKIVMVRACLCGTGSVRFDDIRLEVVEPEKTSQVKASSLVEMDLSKEASMKKLEELAGGKILESRPIQRDCMVLSYLPEWNHGQVDNIAVANYQGGVRLLVNWDRIPESLIAPSENRFVLAIYARDNRGPGKSKSATLSAFEIQEDWTEKTSWKTLPKHSKTAINTPVTNDIGWKLIDVTKLVREQAAEKRSNYGAILRFVDEKIVDGDSFHISFVSREGLAPWDNLRPMLLVVNPSP